MVKGWPVHCAWSQADAGVNTLSCPHTHTLSPRTSDQLPVTGLGMEVSSVTQWQGLNSSSQFSPSPASLLWSSSHRYPHSCCCCWKGAPGFMPLRSFFLDLVLLCFQPLSWECWEHLFPEPSRHHRTEKPVVFCKIRRLLYPCSSPPPRRTWFPASPLLSLHGLRNQTCMAWMHAPAP